MMTRPHSASCSLGAVKESLSAARFALSAFDEPLWQKTPMTPRRIFVAGATGAVGQRFIAQAAQQHADVVPHVRPKSSAKLSHANLVSFELTAPKLVEVLSGCTTVVQLIGTMRKRFAQGDTYETSDIGTTRSLVEAAKAAQNIDHFVLLTSVGADKPRGAYLKAKAEAERLVRESGIPFTIFRPSGFEDRQGVWLPGARAFTRLFGLKRFEPIKLDELASALLRVAVNRAPLGQALEGQPLWDQVRWPSAA